MFTGLIEAVGTVVDVAPRKGASRIGVASAIPASDLADGESVSVDGACLTVVRRSGDRFFADAVAETLARTTLGTKRPGDRVNLERALRLGDRLGGHLVLGHVDAAVAVVASTRRGDDRRIGLAWAPEIRPYVAFKGSVAVNGVSLTVAAVGPRGFEIALIPDTVARTTLGGLRAGDRVNVEVDVIARYLETLASHGGPGAAAPRGRSARGRTGRTGSR